MKRAVLSVFFIFFFFLTISLYAQQRTEFLLEKNWRFCKGDFPQAISNDFNDKNWEEVRIPHDWAIYGPFDRKHDLQEVAIIQNGEKVPTVKTGRTGGLPYMGVGWYRTFLM
ncbi:MAG: beta-galactosidase [Bacteroidota bacterium]|jgi:beta-galactosidase|nr:beta-galactosidase [Bacteroidota bacterium]MDK2837261.1 beta-galactosidase [Bacteroidota bacterium]